MIKSIEWLGDRVRFIDQTKLPHNESYIETSDVQVIADAIRTLKLRGAPLIGISAAYGVALAALSCRSHDLDTFRNTVHATIVELSSTRPTAINLFYALQRMQHVLSQSGSIEDIRSRLIEEAKRIHQEDQEMCRNIGKHGAALIPETAAILTHCNTGALATGGEGTAQSIITTAHRQGKNITVYADETRPALQGARLTAWELMKHGISVTLITDSTGPVLMKQGKVHCVVIGADRIAANGDIANKIGSYSLAVSARYHNILFYVAAPSSTIDRTISSEEKIPIELRSETEITEIAGHRIAPEGASAFAPAFDTVPASLITAIITEKGVHRPPFSFA